MRVRKLEYKVLDLNSYGVLEMNSCIRVSNFQGSSSTFVLDLIRVQNFNCTFEKWSQLLLPNRRYRCKIFWTWLRGISIFFFFHLKVRWRSSIVVLFTFIDHCAISCYWVIRCIGIRKINWLLELRFFICIISGRKGILNSDYLVLWRVLILLVYACSGFSMGE